MKFICTLCNYIYEESEGLPAANIPANTPFESLAQNWKCPDCAASGDFFQPCSCASLGIFEATICSSAKN